MFGISKYHVAAGSYYASGKEQKLLQAFLGTCVGVTLYDKTARVGGLIHILLPEPVSSEGSLFPEKYASTAMPIFIQALCDAGADKKNLSAVIAGGALVGPIDERDLALDIGGRSVDVVRQFLSREHIPVERSETGGFFTCCLSLDLVTGETRIDPAGHERYEPDRPADIPSREEINRAIQTLKPIPQVALKILRLVGKDDYDIDEIAEEVRKDQVISAKTLQLCNSAMFSMRQKVDTLDHALLLIGQHQLIKLVISASVKRLFDPGTQGYSLCKGGLYHHALGTAIIAEKLAQRTGKAQPGVAYTAGLLHDIGKVVLDQYITPAYPLFYRNVAEKHLSFQEAEKRILGIDHTEVGRELAEKWGFPDSLVSAICHHHVPENDPQHRILSHVLYLADLLMERFQAGLELEQTPTGKIRDRLAEIGIPLSQLPELVDAIPEGVFTATGQETEGEWAA